MVYFTSIYKNEHKLINFDSSHLIMIPNIIHQIWIQGLDNLPPSLNSYRLECNVINNNFTFMFWDNNKIRTFIIKNYDKKYIELYDKYNIPAQKADFARYAILYQMGGIYLDMDMICRKNLDKFLQLDFFCCDYVASKYVKKYLNGIIGSKPKHPVFEFIFNQIFHRQKNLSDVMNTTGPKMFYSAIQEYLSQTKNTDINIIERKYLHPCNLQDDELCPYACTDCYVAHTNYSSWSLRGRAIKAFFRYKYFILIVLLGIIIAVFLMRNKFR